MADALFKRLLWPLRTPASLWPCGCTCCLWPMAVLAPGSSLIEATRLPGRFLLPPFKFYSSHLSFVQQEFHLIHQITISHRQSSSYMWSERSTRNRNAFLHRAQKKCAWARKKGSFVKEGMSTGMEIAQHLFLQASWAVVSFFPPELAILCSGSPPFSNACPPVLAESLGVDRCEK